MMSWFPGQFRFRRHGLTRLMLGASCSLILRCWDGSGHSGIASRTDILLFTPCWASWEISSRRPGASWHTPTRTDGPLQPHRRYDLLAACDAMGLVAGRLAAGSWVLQPNLFGHGHYASYDAVLSSLWILAVAVFANVADAEPGQPRPRGRWLACVSFGVLLGFAAGTKLTGWFLPIPFMAWTILYRSRLGFRAVAVGTVIAPLVLLAIMPPWWTEPLVGLFRFFNSNLSRSETITIPIQFLGTTYVTPTPDSLPWYNTLVWTIFVTPSVFCCSGVWDCGLRSEGGTLNRLECSSLDTGHFDGAPRNAACSGA